MLSILTGVCGLVIGFVVGIRIAGNQMVLAWDAAAEAAEKQGRVKIGGRWFRVTPFSEADKHDT